ncbi:MAG TPA: ribonuclease Y [Chloroflexi bacterium]|nr:ribonuclease Y [Chloroflexota bacterium]
MNQGMMSIAIGAVALVVGALAGYLLHVFVQKTRRGRAMAEAETLIQQAQARAREIVLAARDEALKIRTEVEAELERRRRSLKREEERLQARREELERRAERLEERERRQNKRQSRLDKLQNEIEALRQKQLTELERVAQMTRQEAQEALLKRVEQESRREMARVIREVEAEIKEEADARARKLITEAIQRVASDQVAEVAVSTVPLPNDEMKGRIIGRGGRNIRAFEQAAGVDVVVDDTPEAVVISSFDPVRREIARLAMTRLVTDGRIHPARIEKVLADARREVEAIIREAGEQAAYEAGVPGLHREIIKLLGRLKFRTSYGQNQHQHAIETARLAGILAAELGANVEVAKAGGLLHDIGKAVDRNMEGTHALIGAEICRRYGVPEPVVHCIEAHHHEVEPQTIEAVIVEAADAISGARPGARRESLEAYLKRIQTLEELAYSFKGVEEAYALQAGREIRIIVKPDEIDDLATIQLSKEIARKVEESMQYPGQVKVTVIRQTRAVDYAK